jgi:hypothetical protein
MFLPQGSMSLPIHTFLKETPSRINPKSFTTETQRARRNSNLSFAGRPARHCEPLRRGGRVPANERYVSPKGEVLAEDIRELELHYRKADLATI